MFGIKPMEVIFLSVMVVPFLFIWWRLLSKTGHRGWLALIFLVPIVNVGFVIYLAFSEWPIEQELKRLHQSRN